MTKDALETHTLRLNYVINTLDIGTDRIYNVDKTGVAKGESDACLMIGTALTAYSEVTGTDSRKWVSVLEYGSATRVRIRPYVVFSGKKVKGQWFSEDFPN